MKLAVLFLSLFAVNAQAGSIAGMLSGTYDLDITKPVTYSGVRGLQPGSLIGGSFTKTLVGADVKFLDLTKAQYCDIKLTQDEPQELGTIELSTDTQEVTTDIKMLFGVPATQVKWIQSVGFSTSDARMYDLDSGDRRKAFLEQKQAGCRVVNAKDAQLATSVVTAKVTAEFVLVDGAKDAAAKIVDAVKFFLGEGFTVRFDYKSNTVRVDSDKEAVIGVATQPAAKFLAELK